MCMQSCGTGAEINAETGAEIYTETRTENYTETCTFLRKNRDFGQQKDQTYFFRKRTCNLFDRAGDLW